MRKDITIFNVIMPLWMLIFLPSPLWLFLIPANYLVDYLVLRYSLRKVEGHRRFCRRYTLPICFMGFLCDFIGTFPLFVITEPDSDRLQKIQEAVMWNPFSHPLGFLVVASGILLAGIIIFQFDRRILETAGLASEHARRAARNLAVLTAPYLFLLPLEWFS